MQAPLRSGWADEGRLQDALELARELKDKTEETELTRQIAERIRVYQAWEKPDHDRAPEG